MMQVVDEYNRLGDRRQIDVNGVAKLDGKWLAAADKKLHLVQLDSRGQVVYSKQ